MAPTPLFLFRSLVAVACASLFTTSVSAAPRALPRNTPLAPSAQPAPPAIPRTEAVGDTISPPPQIAWKEIAQLPVPAGFKEQPGLAGAYASSRRQIAGSSPDTIGL